MGQGHLYVINNCSVYVHIHYDEINVEVKDPATADFTREDL
jgi:hypothetical protein